MPRTRIRSPDSAASLIWLYRIGYPRKRRLRYSRGCFRIGAAATIPSRRKSGCQRKQRLTGVTSTRCNRTSAVLAVVVVGEERVATAGTAFAGLLTVVVVVLVPGHYASSASSLSPSPSATILLRSSMWSCSTSWACFGAVVHLRVADGPAHAELGVEFVNDGLFGVFVQHCGQRVADGETRGVASSCRTSNRTSVRCNMGFSSSSMISMSMVRCVSLAPESRKRISKPSVPSDAVRRSVLRRLLDRCCLRFPVLGGFPWTVAPADDTAAIWGGDRAILAGRPQYVMWCHATSHRSGRCHRRTVRPTRCDPLRPDVVRPASPGSGVRSELVDGDE